MTQQQIETPKQCTDCDAAAGPTGRCAGCEAERSAANHHLASKGSTAEVAQKETPPEEQKPAGGQKNGTQPKPVKPQAAPVVGTMSLANVKKGAQDAPYRVALYGVPGIGKSTYGAEAPNPIFVPVEQSPNIIVAKFPQPQSWQHILDAVKELGTTQHDYKTLVLDSVDKMEPLAWDACIEDDRQLVGQPKASKIKTIEHVGGGFMKGYVAAVDKWRKLLHMLERLQEVKKMNVILIAHAHIKQFKNPEDADYDRWEMKVHAKVYALIFEWVDAMLFTNYRTKVAKDWRGKSLRKGESDGGRMLYTERTAAYDAKNRYGLPRQISLGWKEFDEAVKANRDPESLIDFIKEKLSMIEDQTIIAWTNSELEKKPALARLTIINNKLAAKLDELEESRREASGGE